MEIHGKSRLLLLAAALLAAMPAFAAEKIQITGSTSVQIPKPSEILEDPKKGRSYDGPSGRSTYEGAILPQNPTPLLNNPLADKKYRDAIDRKKNWIFIPPNESHDYKTEQFLKGEKGTGLYNHPLMQQEEKGVVQRFIEHDKNGRKDDTGGNDSGDYSEREQEDQGGFRSSQFESELPGENSSKTLQGQRGLVLTSPLAKNPLTVEERNQFEERLSKNPLKDSIFGSNNRTSERSAFTPEERQARDAEMNKIYQPRLGPDRTGGIAAVPGGTDPLSTFDVTRQEATPFSGKRTDPIFNAVRSDPGVARNSPIFTGPPLGSTGSGASSRIPQRSGFDINARAPQASPFAPSVSAQAPRATGPSQSPAPFILPFPQRKF